MNIEQEIWDDFKRLSERPSLEKMSNSLSRSHFGLHSKDGSISHYGAAGKKILYDEDYKISEYLEKVNIDTVDWDTMLKLYPVREKIQIREKVVATNYRILKKQKIDTFLLTDWINEREMLYEKIPNEKAAKEYLQFIVWGIRPKCYHCGSEEYYTIEAGGRYKCANKLCYKKFSVKKNTIFDSSNLALLKWYEAIYLLSSLKTKNISSYQLSDALSVTQMTAWRMATKIQPKIGQDFISKIILGIK